MRGVQYPKGEWENLLSLHAPSVLQIEVGTLAPRPKDRGTLPELGTAAPTSKLQPLATTNPTRPAPPGPNTAQGEHRPTGFPSTAAIRPRVGIDCALQEREQTLFQQQTAAVICSTHAARRGGVLGFALLHSRQECCSKTFLRNELQQTPATS